MKDFAKAFYNSPAWKSTRKAYMKKAGGLCEECLKKGLYNPAVIVHHKTWLTPENINDPKITLSFDNLEAVCMDCHEEIHHDGIEKAKGNMPKRYKVDALGRVIVRDAAETP